MVNSNAKVYDYENEEIDGCILPDLALLLGSGNHVVGLLQGDGANREYQSYDGQCGVCRKL